MSGGSHGRHSGRPERVGEPGSPAGAPRDASQQPARLGSRLRPWIAAALGRRPRRSPGQTRRPHGAWRVGTPVVVLLCGGLFVVSAANSHGTDLRPGRYTDLASLVKEQSDQYDHLREQVGDLNDQVSALTATMADREVTRYHRRVEHLKDPAGLVPRTGPGVTVTLSDAPQELLDTTTGDIRRLLVHQQDIQAVVNALWRGGATAVTIEGQRVVSTTGIKCDGPAVQLQGVPYPPPYTIQAVGDQAALVSSVEDDPAVQEFRSDAADPSIAVGWDLQLESSVTAPAFDGLLDLNYAVPLDPAAQG